MDYVVLDYWIPLKERPLNAIVPRSAFVQQYPEWIYSYFTIT